MHRTPNRPVFANPILRFPLALALVALGLVGASAATGQEWNAAQTEVWNTVRHGWERWAEGDLEGSYEIIHPDFVWWNYITAVPGGYDAARAYDSQTIRESEIQAWDIEPLHILAYDTFAVVHYYGRSRRKSRSTGEITFSEARYTEVLKKEGDRWLTVANHWGNTSALK